MNSPKRRLRENFNHKVELLVALTTVLVSEDVPQHFLEEALRFSVLRFRPFLRSFFFSCCTKEIFGKHKIGFSDLLLDAVWCFSDFSSENKRLSQVIPTLRK